MRVVGAFAGAALTGALLVVGAAAPTPAAAAPISVPFGFTHGS
jgi:hypothetical protein